MKFNFQLVIMIVFIAAAIFGTLVFSGAIPLGEERKGSLGSVTLWGTVSQAALAEPLKEWNDGNSAFTVKYVEKSAATFDRDLLEALASGKGPDLFFLPADLVYHYADKILKIPYASYPVSSFKNTFAGAGEVFLTPEGILALPMSIDPLVLYYSRSMLDAEGIVEPPKNWEEFGLQAVKLTKKDAGGKIERSGAALGQHQNVAHAKDILATLFLQAGNPIVAAEDGIFVSKLDSRVGSYNLPSILEFYVSFADPNNPLYSWNRSFANSQDVFSGENLVFYMGYASELPALVNKNPNQNFFTAPMPQIKDAKGKATFARVDGLAVSAFSKNLNTALQAANLLSSGDFAAKYAEAQGVAPARRNLLARPPADDAFSPIFYSSALFARSWLDPSPEETENIFSVMINSVLANSMPERDAIRDASSKLQLLLYK